MPEQHRKDIITVNIAFITMYLLKDMQSYTFSVCYQKKSDKWLTEMQKTTAGMGSWLFVGGYL